MDALYLDYAATTPADPAVLDAMRPYWHDTFGNPSSAWHAYGWAADEAVQLARERVAALLGADAKAITFTSGATEALNLALRGAADAYHSRRNHVSVVATEHKAVLATAKALARWGLEVTLVPVLSSGVVDLDALQANVSERTLLVAAMWGNNETGVLHPVRDVADVAHAAGAFFLCDATQAAGRVPLDVDAAGIDLLALSAHKVYGPKGAGALFARRRDPRVRLVPQLTGGGQEADLRAGTLNVPGIVGLGKAAELAAERLDADAAHLRRLRDRLEAGLREKIPGARVNGAAAERLPHVSSVTFPGAPTAKLVPEMRGLAVSTGSACRTRNADPSHVLRAMGLSDDDAFATVRFSLGRPTTEADVDRAVEETARAVAAVRAGATSAPPARATAS